MKDLLEQSEPVTISENVLKRRIKRPFHRGGWLDFLNGDGGDGIYVPYLIEPVNNLSSRDRIWVDHRIVMSKP